MAIWFVVLFLKRTLIQLFKAESADKMLRMKFLEHGGNTSSCNKIICTLLDINNNIAENVKQGDYYKNF